MKNATHTPGPWDVRKIDSAPGFRGIFGICSNHGSGSIAEEESANARLIAAAPEMLKALKDAASELRLAAMMLQKSGVTSWSRTQDLGNACSAIIAKTESK